MSKTLSIKNINTSPALTWNWLKMNRASVEVDADESVICDSKEICSSQVIHLDFEDGKNYSHEQTVTAEEGKEITVILDYSSLPEAGGFSTIKTKLIAKPYSKIHLVKVQLLGSNFVQIDETYGECDDNARIEVTQIELGGSKVFAQVKNELKGYKSKYSESFTMLLMQLRMHLRACMLLNMKKKTLARLKSENAIRFLVSAQYAVAT